MGAATDEQMMARALRLAAAGTGATYPNPSVGAVVARGGRVLGRGRSRATGGAHAEVVALTRAGSKARGSTLYVTLEPCRHHGRTPPCTRAIVAAGITRVVVGVRDPAPHASGKGLSELRRAGIDVIEGVGAAAARHVHAHYLHHVSSGRPWVTLKAALSLDGQVATASGDSQWITGQAARKDAHRLRARHHAIAVGIGTLESDDPALTVRFVTGVDPIPVLFDSALRSAALVRRRRLLREGTLVLCTARASKRDRARLEHAGVETVRVRADAGGRVSIAHALDALGQREIRSLMVEGGGTLLGAFVAADRWEQMVLYQAPRLLGEGRAVLAGFSVPRVAAGPALTVLERRRLGVDERIVLGRA